MPRLASVARNVASVNGVAGRAFSFRAAHHLRKELRVAAVGKVGNR